LAAIRSRSASQLRAGWRRLKAGPSLVRGAGYGFAAVALIQGTLLSERIGTGAPMDEGARFGMAELGIAEPAAGPEAVAPSAEAVADDVPDARPPEPAPGCEPRLLRAIEERDRQLDAWASDLADRARMLEVIEARAAEQVRALEAQRRALETTLAGVEQGAEAEVTRLVKIYENMNPKEAARIFEAMPAEVAAGFIRRMSESKSALVMGRLNAEHAYAITLAVANSPEPAATP
jgi:flagellar motility protein MotE (MotC chaperone)